MGLLNPEHTGMLYMGRAIRRFKTFLIQGRTENLGTFQYYFSHMLITVIARTLLNIFVKDKYIHPVIYVLITLMD